MAFLSADKAALSVVVVSTVVTPSSDPTIRFAAPPHPAIPAHAAIASPTLRLRLIGRRDVMPLMSRCSTFVFPGAQKHTATCLLGSPYKDSRLDYCCSLG